jgi:toxin YoeB
VQYTTWDDRRAVKRVNALIADIKRGHGEDDPHGLGKPELLRGEWSGWSSRRITQEHRLIYRVRDGQLEIIVCRWHYAK